MKKFLIVFFSFILIPAFGMCSIEDTNSVCSLPNLNNSNPMSKQTSITPNSRFNSTLNNFETPQNKNFSIERKELNNNIKDNTGCQFGNCVQDFNPNQNSQ